MDWRSILLLSFIGGALGDQPVLRPQLESVEKALNDSYVVFCQASGSVYWQGPKGNTIPLPNTNKDHRVHVENKPQLGLGLFLDRIEVTDRGRYNCVSDTNEKASFELLVVRTLQFVNTPTEHRINENSTDIIRCEVVGEPKPLITWQRNNISIDSSQDRKYVPDPKGLKIIHASKNDSGVFQCRAHQFGKTDSFIQTVDIVLKVQHKPEWKEAGVDNVKAYGYVTGETNLSCEAVAQPEANYTWYRNNKEIKPQNDLNATEIQESGRSVLKIHIGDELAFGQYQCRAKNGLGSIKRTFELLKGDKPNVPTGLRVMETTVHSAKLKIASEVPDLLGYRAQFVIARPGQDISWDHPEYQDLLKGETGHYIIRDLLEDTPYAVRVAARSPAGLSDYTTSTHTLRTAKTGVTGGAERKLCQQLPLFLVLSLIAVH